jgi:hypothetical protein
MVYSGHQQMSHDQGLRWRVYRVVAITEENGDPDDPLNTSSDQFELRTSAPTYCTPSTCFWLSLDGIEDPDSECILIEFGKWIGIDPEDTDVYGVVFDYDGGRYAGRFTTHHCHPSWAGQNVHATLFSINSL